MFSTNWFCAVVQHVAQDRGLHLSPFVCVKEQNKKTQVVYEF